MKFSALFRRSELSRVLWTFQRVFWSVAVFSMISNVMMLAPTLYMLQIFDRVTISRSELTLLMLSLITLFLFSIGAFSEWMRSKVLISAGLKLDAALSQQVFDAIFAQRLKYHNADTGRTFSDLMQLRQFLTGNGILSLLDIPWTLVYLAVVFVLSPYLGFLAIGFAIIQGMLVWLGHSKVQQPSQQANDATADENYYLRSKVAHVESLLPMGMLGNLQYHWGLRHTYAQQQQGDVQALTHRITAWSKFIRYSQQSLSLGAGALLVIDGQMSPGAMIAANVLMTRTLAPIDQLAGVWRGFLSAKAAFLRIDDLLANYRVEHGALQRVVPQGILELRDVFATAPGREKPILKGVSFKAVPGTVNVIIGPSGSGKSTLARCMIGVWPQIDGEVIMDERPLAGWNRDELGPYLGYLPQDIELFEGTIAENIARFGEVDAQKVIKAARDAGLHEMILRFPMGYETQMGEAGNLLSGGQRQRIGLARAIYGQPILVVLDEPNANLDDVGEIALVSVLKNLKAKGSTVVVVTHRPGILEVADRVLWLRDGMVQADGPRDVVMAALRAENAARKALPSH